LVAPPTPSFSPPASELHSSSSRTLADAGLVASTILVAGILSWTLGASFLVAEIIIYGPPLAYLCTRSATVREAIDMRFAVKAIAFCAIFYTYVGVRHEGWTGPSALPLVFGVPIEQALWGALVIPLSIAVNQHFFAMPTSKPPLHGSRTLVYSLFVGGLAIALIPPLRNLMDGYAYLKIGLVIYPLIFLLALRLDRSLLRELLLTAFVFFCIHLGFELLAMHQGYWGYRGEYVGWVSVAGSRFPLEELVFIIILSSPCVVAVHALRYNWKGVARPCRLT
jgi:hypothetical protein